MAPDLNGAAVIAHLLESDECHPAIDILASACPGLPASLGAMGSLTLDEKAARLGNLTGQPLTRAQLIPGWVIPLMALPLPPTIDAFQTSPPTWLRVIPAERDSIVAGLRPLNIQPEPHPRIASAISVPRGMNLRSLPRPIRDRIDIQDLASQVTSLICNPEPGQNWWDACAGSGGKSLQLAALAGSTSTILATDIRPSMLENLHRRLEDTGTRNITSAVWDGLKDPPPQGPFDGILLDAPCSGMGTWHRNPDARWRIKAQRVNELAGLQAKLLEACSTRLKRGGALVYATCTLTALENGEIIREFLETASEFKLEPFANPMNQNSCAGMLQIAPWEGPCNGMFIAKLRRS